MLGLFFCPGIGGMTKFVQTTFVANAYRTTVEWLAMGTYFEQSAVLGHRTIFADVEVVSYGTESTCFVVVQYSYGGSM